MCASPNKVQAWRYKGQIPSSTLTVETTPKRPTPQLNNFDSNLTPTRQARGNNNIYPTDLTPNKSYREPSSPFDAGKRNGSFRSPTFESKLFTNLDYPERRANPVDYTSQNAINSSIRKSLNLTPKIGERENLRADNRNTFNFPNNESAFKSGPKSISSTSSGMMADDLVCNNCVNREITQEQMLRKMKESEHDRLLKQIQDSNYRQMQLAEQQRAMENKERFKQDIKDIQLQKQMLKDMEKEEKLKASNMYARNDDHLEQHYRDISANRQADLKKTLLDQMRDKELSKMYDRFQDNGKAGLSLRDDEDEYLRMSLAAKQNAGADLKSQIIMNEEKKRLEKNLEKENNEKSRLERRRAEEAAQQQLILEDLRKKNSLKNGILNQIQERKLNEEVNKLDEKKYGAIQQELRKEMEKMNLSELMNKKNAEKELEMTLKNQITAKQMQRDIERENEKAFRTAVCQHKQKLYACSICSRKYPKNFMSKRSVSPFRVPNSKGGF